MEITGWGCYPVIDAKVSAPRNERDLLKVIRSGDAIARGNGRAYGDSAISGLNTIHMRHFNRMLAFNSSQGQLVAEAGVLLADIIQTLLPRGWFPAVTPGTKFVTLGGMIAADVHGKNHHKDGSLGNYIDWVDVVTADGSIQRCSKHQNKDLFEWTIGGMGLTGVILRASMRLRPVSSSWIEQKTLVTKNLSHTMQLFEQYNNFAYSVAWIDCLKTGPTLGRSILMLGEHAEQTELPLTHREEPLTLTAKKKITIPRNFPSWALNGLSVKAFNALYYWNGKRKPQRQLVDFESFFYPLDSILGWNKIYGRRGLAQFQCVLPLKSAEKGLSSLLQAISTAGAGSFLAVLKRFGVQESRFSFPMEGYTLALDFPINSKTLVLMEQLDGITLKYGGRFYLAKDSRMLREVFQDSDARGHMYEKYRKHSGASTAYNSNQSERLGI